jgi:hypothetical protein
MISKPLTEITSPGKFVWGEQQTKAFEELKQRICEAPLYYLDYTKDIIIRTDASEKGLGGVLLQEIDDEEKIVA